MTNDIQLIYSTTEGPKKTKIIKIVTEKLKKVHISVW